MFMPAVALTLAALPGSAQPDVGEPVRLIFDTDMGNDIDDALALAMIHALEARGECKLLAVTLTKDNRFSAPFVDLVNTFYGRGEVPIGVVRGGVTPEESKYTRGVVEAEDDGRPRYRRTHADGAEFPDAVEVLREVLAKQPDGSVVAVQVGFSTNLARLLDSKPEAHSPLTGRELVEQKVDLLSPMAGVFVESFRSNGFGEYNVKTDLAAAKKLFAEWPTPVVASGFEIGEALRYPARSILEDFRYVEHHPIPEAYALYMKMPYDRPTWDLTSVLYAVRPEYGYFGLSKPGRIVVLDDGQTRFEEDPDGTHRYLVLDEAQAPRVLECLQLLCSQPPRR